MLGFAGGVMIAASYWSLLAPAIEMSKGQVLPAWFPATVGFLLGGLCLRAVDRLLPHLHVGFPLEEAEGVKTTWRQNYAACVSHHLAQLPGGSGGGRRLWSCCGRFALGHAACRHCLDDRHWDSESSRRDGRRTARATHGVVTCEEFLVWTGSSGMIEPIAGVMGAAIVIVARSILPYALAFAAGAMIFVVIEEVIAEAQHSGNTDLATLGAMLGFAVMMVLDVAFSEAWLIWRRRSRARALLRRGVSAVSGMTMNTSPLRQLCLLVIVGCFTMLGTACHPSIASVVPSLSPTITQQDTAAFIVRKSTPTSRPAPIAGADCNFHAAGER